MKKIDIFKSMRNGFFNKCPKCNGGKLFFKFLQTYKSCKKCNLPFFHHRADDFPPYIVIFIVGHIVLAAILHIETYWDLSMAFYFLIFIPLSLFLCLALLQPVKGAIIGLQYALKMHGFEHDH